ncbi:thiamine diphosphokinase [Pelagibacteraceae bacterium]|nr:thiamine diphosphokinase [Pelagibacteraceae bacterium]
MSTSAVLVANGEKPVSNYAKQLIKEINLKICVDSNLSIFRELDIEPDIIIGDLDTVDINKSSSKSTIVNEEDQNKTDLEKSLDYCIAQNIKDIYIIGATGERDDHSLANIMIAQQYSDTLNIEMISNFFQIFFVNGSKEILEKKSRNLSMISLIADNRITTSGLEYNLSDQKLNSFSHGISNRIISDKCLIKAKEKLILFIETE